MTLISLRLRPRAVVATGLVVAVAATATAVLLTPTAAAAPVETSKTYICSTKPDGGTSSDTFPVVSKKTYTQPDSVNSGSSFVVTIGGVTLTPDAAGANIIRSSNAVAGSPGPYVEDVAEVNGLSGSYRLRTRATRPAPNPDMGVSRPATIGVNQQRIAGPGALVISGAGDSNPIRLTDLGSNDLIEPASFTFQFNRFAADGSTLTRATLTCDSRGVAVYATIMVNPAGTPTTTTPPVTTTTAPPTTTTTAPPTTTTTAPPVTTTTAPPVTTTAPPVTTTAPPVTTTTAPPISVGSGAPSGAGGPSAGNGGLLVSGGSLTGGMTPVAGTTSNSRLALTGSNAVAPIAITGAVLLVAGAGAIVGARRRRSAE